MEKCSMSASSMIRKTVGVDIFEKSAEDRIQWIKG